MKQMIKIAIAFFWVLFGCTQVQAQANPSGQSNESLIFAAPPPPDNIGEPGRRADAGSRGCGRDLALKQRGFLPLRENEQKTPISSQSKPLTALVPVYKTADSELVLGVTTAAHPTFWFYVPYQPTFTAKLVLRDKAGNLVYQTHVTPPKTPGVVSFSLPSTEAPLKINQLYHWYFKIYCKAESPPLFVAGWIQRKALNPTLENQLGEAIPQERVTLYAANGIWHEALTTAFQLRRTDPNNKSWVNLLRAIGLDNITSEPILELSE